MCVCMCVCVCVCVCIGTQLVITGDFFIDPLNILINAQTCAQARVVNVTTATCVLAAGVGSDAFVVVSSRNVFSASKQAVRFTTLRYCLPNFFRLCWLTVLVWFLF